MADAQMGDRQQIIDSFVTRLVQIRADADDPSFRSMAKRSGAISHATLHDAVQGTRMPSWETTVEFAKACGVDPRTLREEWETASAALCRERADDATEEAASEAGAEPEPGAAAGSTGAAADDVRTSDSAARRFRSPSVAIVAALALVVGAVLALLGREVLGDESTPPAAVDTPTAATASGEQAAASSPACPSNSLEHSSQPPRAPGDGGRLLADVTMKDCSTVPAGKTMTKTWRYLNRGELTWTGRALKRIDPYRGPGDCKTPEEVPIPTTKPGEVIDISVRVTTPSKPTTCFVRWMFIDKDGNYAFPGQKPIYFSVFVR